MIIDKSHARLATVVGVLLLLAAAAYVVCWWRSPDGFDSGGAAGLAFGFAGSALMVFAGLLSARKKAPRRQAAGPASAWLRGHIWFGLLSGPLILMHSGFRFGGALEQALMIVFGIVYFSGVLGAALQHYVPRIMTSLAPRQGIFEQLDVACERLCSHADGLVAAQCGSLLKWAAEQAGEADGADDADDGARGERSAADEVRDFYCSFVRPYLHFHPPTDRLLGAKARRLARVNSAKRLFDEQVAATPPRYHGLLGELASICDERRDMDVQRRVHYWLHGWLFLHVPLSLALLVLGVTHAVVSLLYLY